MVVIFTFYVFLLNVPGDSWIYTLSLHDALPILVWVSDFADPRGPHLFAIFHGERLHKLVVQPIVRQDRKSTRLNSSHVKISYAVFCLKKKKQNYLYNLSSYLL